MSRHHRVVIEGEWLCRDILLSRFEKDVAEKQYKEYLNLGVDIALDNFYSAKRISPILGPNSFRTMVVSMLKGNDKSSNDLPVAYNQPSILEITNFVDRYFLVSPLPSDVPVKTVRNISMIICRDMGGHSLRQIADHYDIDQHRSLSVLLSRARKNIELKSDLKYRVDSLFKLIKNNFC